MAFCFKKKDEYKQAVIDKIHFGYINFVKTKFQLKLISAHKTRFLTWIWFCRNSSDKPVKTQIMKSVTGRIKRRCPFYPHKAKRKETQQTHKHKGGPPPVTGVTGCRGTVWAA